MIGASTDRRRRVLGWGACCELAGVAALAILAASCEPASQAYDSQTKGASASQSPKKTSPDGGESDSPPMTIRGNNPVVAQPEIERVPAVKPRAVAVQPPHDVDDTGHKIAAHLPDAPRHPATEPEIHLSDQHEKATLLHVGDTLPDVVVTTIGGEERRLKDLLGQRLTALMFWNEDNPYAAEQFRRMQREILAPYAEYGVRVVAVHVGPLPENFRRVLGNPPPSVSILVDPEQALFRQLATARLPRTWLLDSDGRVVWLDLEYSRATARNVDNAIQWSLNAASK